MLILSLCGALVACNDTKEEEERRKAKLQRDGAVTEFCDNVLSAMDSDWSVGLSNAQLAVSDAAGEYIIAYYWTDFIGGLLNASDLPTSKIQKLNTELKSDAGKALFSDFTANAGELIPFFKQTGFTSADLSALLYDAIRRLALDSGAVFENSLTRIAEVKRVATNADAVASLNGASVRMNVAKTDYAAFTAVTDGDSAAAKFVSALNNARSGLNALVTFAYNLSITSITDNIFESVSTGALTDITNQEALTYIRSAIGGFGTLKSSLTAQQVENLSDVFDTLNLSFGSMTGTSAIFGVLVSYASVASVAVNYLPDLCTFALSAADAIDESFVASLRTYLETQNALPQDAKLPEANKGIFLAKLLRQMLAGTSAQAVYDAIANVAQNAGTNVNKGILPVYADVLLNLLAHSGEGQFTSKHMDKAKFEKVFLSATAATALMSFKNTYYAYSGGQGATAKELDGLASTLKNYYGGSLPVGVEAYSKQWFDIIAVSAENALATNIAQYKEDVLADIYLLSEDLFAGEIFDLDALAAMSFISQSDQSQAAQQLKEFYGKITAVFSLLSLA